MGKDGDVLDPDGVVAKRKVGIRIDEEMVKKSHVSHRELGRRRLWLPNSKRLVTLPLHPLLFNGRIHASEVPIPAILAGGLRFLTLGGRQ